MAKSNSTLNDRAKSAAVRVSTNVARVASNEMSRLWQAHGIIKLAVHAIGDEIDNGRPCIKEALQAAADIVFASIDALEPICAPEEVAHA